MPNRSGPKLYAQRGQWDVNSSGWSPWSGMFTRPISELTRTMFPPLPSFRSVLAFDEHRNYLEIGCGVGRGLLEVQALMVNSTTSSTSGDNSTAAAPFCATGLSFHNYTHFIYNALYTVEPTSLQEIRSEGIAALFEEGALPPQTVHARASITVRPWKAARVCVCAPVIIDADYNYGLPFLADTFDLILEQAALKWEEPRLLPDPERRLEDYGRFFFDELLRYHSRASFAHTHPWRLPSPRRCCADTPSCVGPHLPCLSLVRVLRIGGSALIDLGLLRQNYGAAAAPSPHSCRTLAAPAPHPRRICATPTLHPRCCRKPLAFEVVGDPGPRFESRRAPGARGVADPEGPFRG